MISMLTRTHLHLTRAIASTRQATDIVVREKSLLSFLKLGLLVWTLVAYRAGRALVVLPIHLFWTPQRAFSELAVRKSSGEYVDSYTRFIHRQRLTVAATLTSILLVAVRFVVIVYDVVVLTKPDPVAAYSTTVTIYPTWDQTALKEDVYFDNFGGGCDVLTSDICAPITNTLSYGREYAPPGDCNGVSDWYVNHYRSAMKYSLASIPNNATITDVDLQVDVLDPTTQSITVFRTSSDSPDTWSCENNSALFTNLSGGPVNYVFPLDWTSTGLKTTDLGSTADSDIAARLNGSDLIGIGVRGSEDGNSHGQVYSVDWSTQSSRPRLLVTYTLPPQAPTSTAHSGNTTTGVTWTWTDNATADTSNRVHDASHVVMCTTGAVASTGSTVSCSETGLSANTQYTRHPNVLDADGNTDGPAASAYTSIQTPTGMNFDSISTGGITVSATGSLSNLTAGSSGLFFRNTVTLNTSGWTQANTWADSGLAPNAQQGYDVKARNGDGDETAFTLAANRYTLSAVPDVSSSRSVSTWYATPDFSFTSDEAFGAGGVQYYRYAWDQSAAHTFSGTESTWSSAHANCPGGSCTTAAASLPQTATADGNTWYLHLRSYNADDVANGSGSSFGPYFFDATGPVVPGAVVDGIDAVDDDTTDSTSTLSANWGPATDGGSSGVSYQYAIGTTSGGTQVADFTSVGSSTTVTRTGLSLTPGTSYYVSVRAVDAVGNVGPTNVSDGITVVVPASTVTVISGVSIVQTSTSATIHWTTNEVATSTVRYGLTSSYGQTASQSGTRTEHRLALSELSPDTTYHFQIESAGSTTATTSDATFETLAASITPSGSAVPPTLLRPILKNGDAPSITVTGVAKGDHQVTVYLDGRAVKTIRTKGDRTQTKTFAIGVDLKSVKAGKHTITAQTKDSAGRISATKQKLTFRIGTVDDSITVQVGTSSTYTVKDGDSLWDLAERYLGDGAQYGRLVTANADQFPSLSTNPSIIQPGWALVIPPG